MLLIIEFDEDGRYMDDWIVWYNDPFSILPMMRRIFAGCHQLVVLEEYQTVYDLLSRIFELKFFIQEGEDSEDARKRNLLNCRFKIKEELSL